ncbi:MAG: hypothetical protein ABSB18_04265 [Candidatus Omnitrophota bacterium]
MTLKKSYFLLAFGLLCGLLFTGGCITSCKPAGKQAESTNTTTNATTGWAKSGWQKVMDVDTWIRKNLW